MKWKTNCIRIFGILVLTNNPLLLLQIFRTKQHETRLIFFMLPNSKRNIFLRDSSNVFKNFQTNSSNIVLKNPVRRFYKILYLTLWLVAHNPTPPLFAEREYNRLHRLQQTRLSRSMETSGLPACNTKWLSEQTEKILFFPPAIKLFCSEKESLEEATQDLSLMEAGLHSGAQSHCLNKRLPV